MLTRADLERRAKGALLGAAIGDAMGAPLEGRSAAEIRQQYGRIDGFLTDSATGTDDTDFTLFNATLLAAYGAAITPADVEREWRDKLLAPGRAYRPGGFSDVVSTRNLRAGLHTPYSGAWGHQMWSDGVAMAISPAGVVAAGNGELAARLARTLGQVSNGRDGIWAAQAVAAAVAVAMVGAEPPTMLRAAIDAVPRNSWTGRCLDRVAAIVAGTTNDLDIALERLSAELVLPWWPWADLATEAVPLALGVFVAGGGEFERVVPAAVSLGRDADTIAAIAGSLAGAYGGVDVLPRRWAERALLSPGTCIGAVAGVDVDELARRLAGRALEAAR